MRVTTVILVSTFSTVIVYAADNEPAVLKVGFSRFRVVNQPVVENAGSIVPELLLSRFMQRKDYRAHEKIIELTVFSGGQDEAMDTIGNEELVKAGRDNQLDLIVWGSVLGIGSQVLVTARVIDVHSGQLLKTSEIRVSSPEDLPEKMEIMAAALADIDTKTVESIRLEKQVKGTRWGFWLGINLGMNIWKDENDPGYNAEKDSSNRFVSGIPFGVYYLGENYNLEAWGRAPVSGKQHSDTLSLMGGKNFSRHLGINIMYRWLYISDEESGGEATFNSLSAGLRFRYTPRLIINMNGGYLLGGSATYPWDATDRSGSLQEMSLQNRSGIFPRFWYFSADYLLDDTWGIRGYLTIDSADSSYNSIDDDLSDVRTFTSYNLGVAVTYNLQVNN